jgi:hypothetical protein
MPSIESTARHMPQWRHGLLIALAMLSGCAGDSVVRTAPARTPETIRAEISSRMPGNVGNSAAWAADLQLALAALKIEPSATHVCAVLAVTEQESTFNADPPVPNLAKVAREEMFRRADNAGIPALAVRLALQLKSPTGKTYDDRLDAVRTERELSVIFEDFIGEVPLGRQLLSGLNPVRTGGPMQVSVAFAEAHANAHTYPWPVKESIRHEVFTRRGGLYFGTAHLLGYEAPYGTQMVYRFADFNAGRWASRNAAFQQALAGASKRTLALDGDAFVAGARMEAPGETESAARALSAALGMSDHEIRRDLVRSDGADFERTALYAKVFAIAEQRAGRKLPRAALPEIVLKSPKFTRRLTTEWFAKRVDERYQRCLTRGEGAG